MKFGDFRRNFGILVGRFYVACESVAVTLQTDAPGDEPRRWPTASSTSASVPERAARTEFRLLATCDDPALSLATATLAEGGRTHQIRKTHDHYTITTITAGIWVAFFQRAPAIIV